MVAVLGAGIVDYVNAVKKNIFPGVVCLVSGMSVNVVVGDSWSEIITTVLRWCGLVLI